MPKAKVTMHGNCFEELMAKLDEIGDTPAMKRGVESALILSKKYINEQIDKVIITSNLPAGGKYSKGDTKESLDREMSVTWDGMTASANVGFDFNESGLTSIFLMYGTPRQAPVKGLKNAVYGSKTNKELGKLQDEALSKVIKRIMED